MFGILRIFCRQPLRNERSGLMLKPHFWSLIGVISVAAVMRLVPHPWNATPIAAMALFGGAYFPNRKAAFLIPLAAMLLSDLALGFFVYDFGWFHSTQLFVYGSFATIVVLGFWVRGNRSLLRIGTAALAGSILFFLVTNLGVWLVGGLYPFTLEGLIACYAAAVPYFRHTLLGDLLYVAVLFGGFGWAQRRFPVLRDGTALTTARV
jgi:hypothetical protein